MKRILSFLFFISLSVCSFTQKSFFIYIQAEKGQPFYVKLADKIYNSSSAGYVILPKLIDSIYTFSLTFVKQPSSPQVYKVEIGRKDHGYIWKNLGFEGWGLYNMQTMSVLTPLLKETLASGKIVKEVSPFTEVLSKASDDPSLKTSTQQKQTEKQEDKEAKVEPGQTASVNPVEAEPKQKIIEKQKEKQLEEIVVEKSKEKEQESAVVTEKPKEKEAVPILVIEKSEEKEQKPVTVVETVSSEYKPTVIKKKSESSTTQGFGLVYTDSYADGHTDTIKLLIENPKTPAVVTEKPGAPVMTKAESKEEQKPAKSPCALMAAESNFYELRKNMASAGDDDAMIREAVKYTKSMCFSTAQYKNLCVLFLNDQGRYKFFDAVYDYTTDPENFPSLQSELKEEYYINRFKAMLRK